MTDHIVPPSHLRVDSSVSPMLPFRLQKPEAKTANRNSYLGRVANLASLAKTVWHLGPLAWQRFSEARQEALLHRAAELRKDVEEMIQLLCAARDEVKLRYALALSHERARMERHYGPITGTAIFSMRRMAKQLRRAGRKFRVSDVGRYYAHILLSAHLEAQTLPGDDAAFVFHGTERMMSLARQLQVKAAAEDSDMLAHILRATKRGRGPQPNRAA